MGIGFTLGAGVLGSVGNRVGAGIFGVRMEALLEITCSGLVSLPCNWRHGFRLIGWEGSRCQDIWHGSLVMSTGMLDPGGQASLIWYVSPCY